MQTVKTSPEAHPVIPRGDYIQVLPWTAPFYESHSGLSASSVGETQVQITSRFFTTYEWDVDPRPVFEDED